MTQSVVVPRYLALVAFPYGFNVDHDIAVERQLSPSVVGGALFLTALLAFALYAIRRWPLMGFGIAWCFSTLSVESSVLPIRDVMVEHRMYLAMPGIGLVVAYGFAWLLVRRRGVAVAAGVVALTLLAVLTVLRNEVWRTPLALWTDALSKSPNKAR